MFAADAEKRMSRIFSLKAHLMKFENIRDPKFIPLSNADMFLVKGGTKTGSVTMGLNPDGSTWHDYVPDQSI
jgi:hypothetical protein